MIDLRTIENVILTNTILIAFAIVLLIILIIFILFIIIPSIRRRYFQINQKQNNQFEDLSTLNRQSSFNSSRFNPIFESMRETSSTQFGTLFHPQATTATLLHPTIWTSMAPTSIFSSPLTLPSTTKMATPSTSSANSDVPIQQSSTTSKKITPAAAASALKPPRKIVKKETA